ncbi:hypothetical protein ASPWEDRAFT_39338 [Aspergillus wentii DTO 134E9]|uniref:L-type lectin-like domain-containing protein n=1 Tax=Aspergillus wentii DTO 134E9 TaxID=1073089 RepID=A0A1L9RRR8_ASPWE|nr:uncharacterized protein ASPWEDRAFT_39338 [Aspergillus wentii DTO 134E9]KAI9930453.1 hypothetical protein MW887_011207 [Aspergillus wentii]OJJ37612.1 hypothetical protein ASPWEDRAFT_39338 [Aspergillus wentii DTO 134E9]
MKIPASFSLFIAAATAQSVIESSSFGYGQTLSLNTDGIPGWQVGGVGAAPQIFSDKIILTPPYPGNTRGFAWSENPVSESEWTAEFQFRATGPERAGGNLQLWYTKEDHHKIGTSSIYTVGQFDGFALVVDTHGGRGGSVRGFLNDGTKDYQSHGDVDSLAFGHCDYSYRNLGRPSVVRIKQTNSIFEVTVDDKLCFSSPKVALPAGNSFGVTAATPENPDSFEVFNFILRTSSPGSVPVQQGGSNQQPIVNQNTNNVPQGQGRPASDSRTMEQYVDLTSRIQLISQATNNIIREIGNQGTKSENRQAELIQKLASKDQVAALDARLQRIEQVLQRVQRDIEGNDYRDRLSQLHDTLKSSHLTLTESLQSSILGTIASSSPRMGFFIFCIIAFQLLLAGSYVLYKRRRANMPKKFL